MRNQVSDLIENCREKIWNISGTEFGSNLGKIMIIAISLYVLKINGALFIDFLVDTLHAMGYGPYQDDISMCTKTEDKPYGFEYWDYVLCYVGNVITISDNPKSIMKYIKAKPTQKGYKVEEPDMYSGSEIYNTVNVDGVE